MKYVVDASVGFKWAVDEPDADKARQLRDDWLKAIHELLATDIFPAEVGNALWVAERRGTIVQGASLLADVLACCPQLHASVPNLIQRAYDIAIQSRASVYDSLYVALAEREQCQLITADDKLVNKLQAQFPFVISLSSIP